MSRWNVIRRKAIAFALDLEFISCRTKLENIFKMVKSETQKDKIEFFVYFIAGVGSLCCSDFPETPYVAQADPWQSFSLSFLRAGITSLCYHTDGGTKFLTHTISVFERLLSGWALTGSNSQHLCGDLQPPVTLVPFRSLLARCVLKYLLDSVSQTTKRKRKQKENHSSISGKQGHFPLMVKL